MKRLISLLLTAVLLLPFGLYALTEEAPAPLTLAEIEQFNQAVLAAALKDPPQARAEEGGFIAVGEGYELLLSTPDVSADSPVLGAALTHGGHGEEMAKAPRGAEIGIDEGKLLALFRNDNPFLAGNRDSAVLYIAGELPAAVGAGFVLRDGQRLLLAEYDVYYQTGEGVSRAGLQFTLEGGYVTAVRSFASAQPLTQQEAAEALGALRETQEQNAYIAFTGQGAPPLSREDLVLSGLDFVDLTRQEAVRALGEPANEESADSGTAKLVTLQWPGLEAVFRTEGEKESALRLSMSDGQGEGPRGLRIGDTLAQAISRFEHGETLPEEGGALYGDAEGQVPPFGALVRGPGADQLYYVAEVEGGKAALILDFIDDLLVNMTLTYL